jgi:hypothetical protein
MRNKSALVDRLVQEESCTNIPTIQKHTYTQKNKYVQTHKIIKTHTTPTHTHNTQTWRYQDVPLSSSMSWTRLEERCEKDFHTGLLEVGKDML